VENKYTSTEDEFLARLASGKLVEQDEYDQMTPDLPAELIASALAKRYEISGETKMLIEAARLYQRGGLYYHALELCSRAPRIKDLQRIADKIIPIVRRDYPDTRMVGKLTDEAMLVIDLNGGTIIRFPPILPTTNLEEMA
jgi:hypothetical protein